VEGTVRIATIWGVPIRLDASWFVVFALVTWTLATGFLPFEYPRQSGLTYLLLGLVTSVLFFGSVLLHELGHVALALREKIPVRGVTMFIFGGVAEITREPETPGAEFRIAIAGPLVSFALAGVFGVGSVLIPDQNLLDAPLTWLSRINLSLALFNLIPGFPLDGGRLLRALVWHFTGNLTRATQVAATGGQWVAYGFIGLGVLDILILGNFIGGLWLILIGWFLRNAARGSVVHAEAQQQMQHLAGVNVSQVMSRQWASVPELTSLDRLVSERVLPFGEQSFVVLGEEEPRGIITVNGMSRVPRQQWPFTTVRQVMVPWERVVRFQPHTDIMDALRIMETENVTSAPVVTGNVIMGIFSREQVFHYLRLRQQLGV
jgi:Zn-dependent protease/CBS domain-containing protein